jgi:hypothetical protein
MKKLRGHFNVVFPAGTGRGVHGYRSGAAGCVTHGRTLAEAKKMARDAIAGYIESLKKHGKAITSRV